MKRIAFLLFSACFAVVCRPASAQQSDTLQSAPTVLLLDAEAAEPAPASGKQRFLPVRRRIDREIDKVKYVYKGEVMMGLTASYGTLSSEDSDFLVILDNINAEGTVASVKPYFGYFYRDNHCVGVRFGYTYIDATLNTAQFDLGEGNDVSFDVPYIGTKSNNYSFALFHRTYAGLDPKGRFGLFAELELSMATGRSEFTYETGGERKTTFSENIQAKFSFNPGAAVYIFPNVCATLSFGLGGLQYTQVNQRDAEGNKLGSRTASKMRFPFSCVSSRSADILCHTASKTRFPFSCVSSCPADILCDTMSKMRFPWSCTGLYTSFGKLHAPRLACFFTVYRKQGAVSFSESRDR